VYKMDKSMSDILYSRLPELYKKYDAEQNPPYQLKNFLKIIGGGMDYLKDSILALEDLFNVDKTPAIFLSPLMQMLGYDYPLDMTEEEKRRFLAILPTLCLYKGTGDVFTYIGRMIFGENCTVDIEKVFNSFILLTIFESIPLNLDTRVSRYKLFAEKFRPVNVSIGFLFISLISEICNIAKDISYRDTITLIEQNEIFRSDVFINNQDAITTIHDYSFGLDFLMDEDTVLDSPIFLLDSNFILSSDNLEDTIIYV